MYLRRGFPRKAIDVLSKGLKNDDTQEGQLLLAQAYFDASPNKASFLNQAAETAQSVVSRDPNSWQAHRLLGEIAYAQDDLQGAIKSLRQAHELNPDHPQARQILKSLGEDVDEPFDENQFYINVDTNFIPPQTDSLFATIRDVTLFLIPIAILVYLYASNSVHGRKIHSLAVLGRTQQRIDTYTALKKASDIYKTIIKKFDKNHPYALIHLAETYHALWRNHERTADMKNQYLQYLQQVQGLRTKNAQNKKFIDKLARWHALKALSVYENAREAIVKGEKDKGTELLKQADAYLKMWLKPTKDGSPKLPPSAWVNWVHGQILESLGKNSLAKENFKRAADMGWNTPKFRFRQGMHFMRVRKFSTAHSQFGKAKEQGAQSANFVQSKLIEQHNENCWIDPPMLIPAKDKPKPGLQLTVTDMLIDGANSAVKADLLPQCAYHPQFHKYYRATKLYAMAPLMDVLAVFDSGVGMAPAFELAEEFEKDFKKFKKQGDASPHVQAWAYFLRAKTAYYKSDYKEARTMVDKAIKTADYEALFHSLSAVLLIKDKKYDDAQKAFDKAIALAPDFIQPYYEVANEFLNVTDDENKPTQNDRVEKILTELKKNFPKHADYFYLLGRLESNKGNLEEAVKHWKKASDSEVGPYFGYHYDAYIQLGRYFLKKARAVNAYRSNKEHKVRGKRMTKEGREELLKQYKEKKKDIIKRIKSFLQTKDMEKHKKDLKERTENFEKFLTALEKGKRIRKEAMNLYINHLSKLYYNKALTNFKEAMDTRPGSVDARLYTGFIYIDDFRYNDALGHFDVATAGYARDLDFKNAEKAFGYLMTAKIGNRHDRKNKKVWPDDVKKFFQQKVFILLNQGVAKLNAARVKLINENKTEEAKKLKSEPKDIKSTAQHISAIANVLGKEKKLKKVAEEINEVVSTLKKKDFPPALAQMKEFMKGGGKKKRGRRRRRR